MKYLTRHPKHPQCFSLSLFSSLFNFTKGFHIALLQFNNNEQWCNFPRLYLRKSVKNSITKAEQGCVQCTLRKPCVGRDWQRHYSILGTLPFRDYSDVTLIPLHGWMLKNYRATNNSTSRVHILEDLRYPLSLLQLTQQQFFFALNDA